METSKSEKGRLRELDTYKLIGMDKSDDYDFITSMAAKICGTKIAFISLITEDKQWFLSHHGLSASEAPREYSFCAQAISKSGEPFIVEDAQKDKRFLHKPYTKGEPQVVFCAGVPLLTSNGFPLGTLCVIDDTPKSLNAEQLNQLEQLARQTMKLFELRRSKLELNQINEQLEKSNALLIHAQEANQLGIWEMDISTGKISWSEMVYEIHELPLDFDSNKTNSIDFYHPDYRPIVLNSISNCIKKNEPFNLECIFITAKGNQKWVKSTGRKVGDKVVGSFQDITKIKEKEIKFRGIFDSTFSFIGFLNRDGILLEANDTAVNTAGIEHKDVIGKYFWDCYWWQISTQTQKELKANFQKALSGETVEYEVAVWISNKTPITILFSLKPIFDDNGNVMWIIPEGRPVQEIIDARRKFKSVIEGTNVGTWEWNIQTGETKFNERWAEIVGYTLEELSPVSIETWMELAHPDDLEESERRLNDCFQKKAEYYELEARMQHKDGHWVWVYDRGKVFEWTEDEKPLMMYGTHQDISQKKNKEIDLNYQKQLLSSLYELSPVGIALNDYETGNFLDVNNKLIEPSGYTKDEFMKLSYWELTPKEYEPLELEALQQMETKGSFELFEKEYIRKDGSRYPVSLQGVVIEDSNGKKLIWSIIRDISKEKESEQRLREALNNLQGVLDASQQVSIIVTDISGHINMFNSGAERMLGYKSKEMVGVHSPSFIHLSEEIEKESTELSKKYNKEISGFETFVYEAKMGIPITKEWTYVRKDGVKVPVLLSVNAIFTENQISGYLGVATDITELKKIEKEIKSLLDITNNQNDRLRNFAHIVSHNLRSHSVGISGILDLLRKRHPEFAENELVDLGMKAAANLKQTVHDLTEVVKINLTEEDVSFIDLYDIVQKNVDSLGIQIKNAEMEIVTNIDKDLEVKGMPAYLDSIVFNMISNAIKYRSEERDSILKIYSEVDNSTITIFFEDNGLGIDLKKHGDKLFGMYNTFHRHADSRGVGLFITKNQIESMGGEIEVESEENLGTTFKITLPR